MTTDEGLVHTQMEGDLSVGEMAPSVGLSTDHFTCIFCKSRAETTHQFVLRRKIDRAKAVGRPRCANIERGIGVASNSQTLCRSFVMSVELARQSIARIF